MPSRVARCLFFFLIATMLCGVAMKFQAGDITSKDYVRPQSCSYFNGQPILDLELASSPDCFVRTVEQGTPEALKSNIQVFRSNTDMDFAFIFLYWTVFVLFALADRDRWSIWIIGFISASASLDVLENTRILKGLTDLLAYGHVVGLLPRSFSLLKWITLALALVSLGILLWHRTGWQSRLLSIAMVACGVLTVAGLVIPVAMTWAVYCFALGLLLSLIRFWPYSLESVLLWIEYAYLMRFQILAGLVLFVGLPLGYYVIPSLFIGLFDGRGFWSFLFIVWAAFQLAWTIMVACRLVLVYAPDRFVRAKTSAVQPVGTRAVTAFGLLALPVVVVLFVGTQNPGTAYKTMAALLGLAVAVCVLALTASLHFAIEDEGGRSAESVFPSFGFLKRNTNPKSRFWKLVESCLKHLPSDLTAGIMDRGRLRSGHEMAMVALAVFAALYVALGWFFRPSQSTPEYQPAALFFLLFILTAFTWLFSGVAFFLDRIRLPVLTTLLVVSLLTGFVGTDHEFVVVDKTTGNASSLSPSDVIHSWESGPRRKNSKTITIVATAGGGIRAAAWTADVMTRLQEHCGGNLSSSLLLVSSVSGGSVGSMFVVGPYSSMTGDYPTSDADLNPIRFNAARSSLSAVGWGLAYPDLVRAAPLFGSLVPQTLDRGWSLENAWATAWRNASQDQPFMGVWRDDVRAGTRPAVIFNATVSESGERFLIASTRAPSDGTVQLFDLFPGSDIRVATAARLSASFPYVSPLARSSIGPTASAYHVGDGGYYDNSGLLSAVEWLRGAADAVHGYQVLLILIDAKPETPKTGSTWSWQKQIIGPIETLLHVRTSSQELRDSIELQMALDYLAAQKNIHPIHASFLFSSTAPSPLSWHLTKHQLDEIDESWGNDENVKSQSLVYDTLGCSSQTTR